GDDERVDRRWNARGRAEARHCRGPRGDLVVRKRLGECPHVRYLPVHVEYVADAAAIVSLKVELPGHEQTVDFGRPLVAEAFERRSDAFLVVAGNEQVSVFARPQLGPLVMRIGERGALDEDRSYVGQCGDDGAQLRFARGVEGGGGTKLVGELGQ